MALFFLNFIPGFGQAAKAFKSGITTTTRFTSRPTYLQSWEVVPIVARGSYVKGLRSATTAASKGVGKSTLAGLFWSFVGKESGLTNPQLSIGYKTKGGCFTGFNYDYIVDDLPPRDDILYTPIIQYFKDEEAGRPQERIYPSAIYIDESFTSPLPGFSEPECTWENPNVAQFRNQKDYTPENLAELKQKIVDDYISKHKNEQRYQSDDGEVQLILDAEAAAEAAYPSDPVVGADVFGTGQLSIVSGFEFGSIVKECKFKTSYQGKKIKYYVWANPTFPSVGTFNTVGKFVEGIGLGISRDVEAVFGGIFGLSSDKSESISKGYDSGYKTTGNLVYTVYEQQLVEANSKVDEAKKKLEELEANNAPAEEIEKAKEELEKAQKEVELAAQELKEAKEKLEKEKDDPNRNFFSQFGSCAYVTLSRDLKISTPITKENIEKEAEKLQFSEPVSVNGISTANSETSPFALVDGQKIYLFFERTTGDAFKPSDVSKEIWYTVSEDGGSTWQEAKRITDYSTGVAGSEPSAVVFNGKIYVAYKERSWEQGVKITTKNFVVVKELNGNYEKRFADVETNDRGGPSMTVFDGELYLFYHQRAGPLIGGDFFKILYTAWDGNTNNDWQLPNLVPTPKKDGVENFLNSPNTWSMYPSAIATSNGIILSYSYSAPGGIGPFHEAFDVRAVRFDARGTTEDLGEISADESGTDIPNRRQGFSHLVEKKGEIFVFYDEDDIARAGKSIDPTEAEFKSHINYKKYNPDSGWDIFPTSLFESKNKAIQATPVAVDEKILLFFSSHEGENKKWEIFSSSGEKKIVLTEVSSEPDVVTGIEGKTEKDSYKVGETVRFAGKLIVSGDPGGKEVKVEFKFGSGASLNIDRVSTENDGSFVWEYELPAGIATTTYEIVASSGGKEVSYKFSVTN